MPNSFIAVWIIPTCGPLLWEITTRVPSSTRSAITFAASFVAVFCSGSVVPSARWPNATTTVFSLIGNTSFLFKIGMKSVTVSSNEYIENDVRVLYFIIKDLCGKCNRKSSVFQDRKNRLIQSDGLIPTIF